MPHVKGAFLVGLLMANAAVVLLGGNYAATCFSVLAGPNAGDALIGVVVVGKAILAVEFIMLALGMTAVALDRSRWRAGRLCVLLVPLAGMLTGAVILAWSFLHARG